jgi:hypothetical protein
VALIHAAQITEVFALLDHGNYAHGHGEPNRQGCNNSAR